MKEKIHWLFLVFFIVMLISNGIYAADIAEIQKNLEEHYTIKKPDGTGPFPAVMLVPGCSGFHAEFRSRVNLWGYEKCADHRGAGLGGVLFDVVLPRVDSREGSG